MKKATLFLMSFIYFSYIFFLSHPFLSISAHPLSLATFQSRRITLPVFLSFSFSPAQLINTVTWPKNTSTPAKRGKNKLCCKLLQLEIFQPLQLSPPSSVKLSINPFLTMFLSPPLSISLIIFSFISLPQSLSLLNLISQSFFPPTWTLYLEEQLKKGYQ